MDPIFFKLQAFEKKMEGISLFSVGGEILREGQKVKIIYKVRGPVDDLILPEASGATENVEELWKHTCFEAFIAAPGKSDYIEWNFSPSGKFNSFAFSDYRKRIDSDPKKALDPVEVHLDDSQHHHLWINVSFDLPASLAETSNLECGISCILEHPSLETSHWALIHAAKKPDFHARSGFLLRI